MAMGDRTWDQRKGNVVFISSTCSDLIDVRREIEEFLQGLGLTPFLSDSGRESFEMTDPEQKLPACLGHVASSCCVVVILSQRYGATARDGRESYTELEYDEAISKRIPVCFFVRKPLFEAYEGWKKSEFQAMPDCPWVLRRDDLAPLLGFIRKRDELKPVRDADAVGEARSDPGDKLVMIFQSVVDLKSQLRHYLRPLWASVLFDEARAAGRLPFIQVAFAQRPRSLSAGLHFELKNIGPTPAIFSGDAGAFLRSPNAERGTLGDQSHECESWAPRRPAVLRLDESCMLRIDAGTIGRFESRSFQLCVRYGTVQGPRVMDVYHVVFVHAGPGDWRLRFVRQELARERLGDSP